MKSVTFLPIGYAPQGQLDLSKNKRLLFGLTLGSLVLFLFFMLLFGYTAFVIGPHIPPQGEVYLDLPGLLVMLAIALIITLIVAVAHELVHAVFFWAFTHEWPSFGFKGLYAYAAAPKWYIPRLPFLLVGVAPLVVLSLVGVGLLHILPLSIELAVVFGLSINAAGAVGDLYVIARLLRAPSTCLVHDEGSSITWYIPDEPLQPKVS